VIKTFPNVHNTVARDAAKLAETHPHHAPVRVIDRDMRDGELAGIYEAADALVAPSRGEGFGMPVAEAALFDLPVIATAHGGHMDILSAGTAWLVDYRFAPAETHLNLPDSVWADPDVADLGRQLAAVRAADGDTLAAATGALRRRVETAFTWDAVATRTRRAMADLDGLPVPDLPPHVAWVTSWNTRCGIADYARHLACRLPAESMTVLANHTDHPLGPDDANVVRCWHQGWADDLVTLESEIRRRGVEAVVLQFNFGFYHVRAFGRLLERLQADGIQTYVFLHSTADVNKPDARFSLGEIPDALAGATRLFVHSIADLNRLKAFGHVANVALFPHGVRAAPPAEARADPRQRYGLGDGRILASFGFLLPNKGLPELVDAFERLRDDHPDLQLLLLNALYPVPASDEAHAQLAARIRASRHADAIALVTDFLAEDTALGLLAQADAIVFPYQQTQESASGAVHFGLASGRPVATTPLAIFDDVAAATYRLPGTDPADIARGLADLLADRDSLDGLAAKQAAWLDGRQWEVLSERLWNILIAEARAWPARAGATTTASDRSDGGAPVAEAAQ
jgi:glycosyltransferase involved in cell wall biosynthesis